MNIEKTISEQAVSDILTPMLESQDRIVTEDVAPLFDQATGLDTPPASGSVTTTIEESRSVITAIIRKAWTATLTMLGGASVISYIAAAYTYLLNRLQGNETYGIPDRRSEISASSPLAANLALLNDRKIGGADVPDGMSVGRILGDSTLGITEITDDTEGWTMNKEITGFENMRRLALNAITINTRIAANRANLEDVDIPHCKTINAEYGKEILWNIKGKEEMEFPELEVVNCGSNSNAFGKFLECKKLSIPNFRYVSRIGNASFLDSFPILEWLYIPKFEGHNGGYGGWPSFCKNNPVLQRVTIGDMQYYSNMGGSSGAMFGSCPKLIRMEISDGIEQTHNLLLNAWNPSYVLSDNPTGTDLIEEGSTAQNNLQQFLQNFRSFIALRLTDNGSGKTLTLSQAVFSEIWDSQGQPQVKGDGLDDLRADIHRIIRTDKQWAVNKA